MIHFPAIFKFTGLDELLYIADQSDFYQHYQLQQAYLTPQDLLIDSSGKAYLLQQWSWQKQQQPITAQFDLHELTALVQAHFFSSAQSCVTKIQAASIESLFNLLRETN